MRELNNFKRNTYRLLIVCIWFFSVTLSKAQIVYTVDRPSDADVVVYVVDDESKCDLKVFFVEEKSQLGKQGVWMGTFNKDEAAKKIYITLDEAEAQLKIFVVDDESKTGWVNEDKKKLIE